MEGSGRRRLVVIGGSRGALRVLRSLLGALPAGFPLPVVVVLHRVPTPRGRLVEVLQSFCALPVVEPEDKQPIAAGAVFLAPADYHLLIGKDGFVLSTDPPLNYSRPSIDVTFESAAEACGGGVIGMLLTGSNADGAAGLLRIRQAGGLTLVENPGSATAPEMPSAAIRLKAAERVLRVGDLARVLADAAGAEESVQTMERV